jgi:hypothetical protein
VRVLRSEAPSNINLRNPPSTLHHLVSIKEFRFSFKPKGHAFICGPTCIPVTANRLEKRQLESHLKASTSALYTQATPLAICPAHPGTSARTPSYTSRTVINTHSFSRWPRLWTFDIDAPPIATSSTTSRCIAIRLESMHPHLLSMSPSLGIAAFRRSSSPVVRCLLASQVIFSAAASQGRTRPSPTQPLPDSRPVFSTPYRNPFVGRCSHRR